MSAAFWTDAKLEEARRLLVDEGHSAGAVYRMIGAVSRNAVLGKAWRLNWRQDPAVIERNRRRAAQRNQILANKARLAKPRVPKKPRSAYARTRKPEAVEAAPLISVGIDGSLPQMDVGMPANAEPVEFFRRKRCQCAWPIGSPKEAGGADMLCCGAPVAEEKPYCATHERRAHRPGKPRRKDDLAGLATIDRFIIRTEPRRAAA